MFLLRFKDRDKALASSIMRPSLLLLSRLVKIFASFHLPTPLMLFIGGNIKCLNAETCRRHGSAGDMPEDGESLIFGVTRKSLEGIVIYACPQCGAAGVLNGSPVGDVCPQCGGLRRKDRFLGELSASMPLWAWQAVLMLKWCILKSMKLFV